MPIDINSLVGQIIHADCLEVLRELPDKSVDLVLTDPPYGIGVDKMKLGKGKHDYYKGGNWDVSTPNANAFEEIQRVSKNQIVWGGNYFELRGTRCWLVWDKGEQFYGRSFGEVEIAYTSFDRSARIFKRDPLANRDYTDKCHPTQKPVPLFKWCVHNYSKSGDIILDPFAGSGTTALACHALGRHFICIERELEYVNIARNRFAELQAQGDLFLTGSANPLNVVGGQSSPNTRSTPVFAQVEMEL